MNFRMNKIHKERYLIILILAPTTFAIWNKYFVINSKYWRFTNVSRLEQKMQNLNCLALCDHTLGCEFVNHNFETKSCELQNPGPWKPTEVSKTESNWMVYYKGDKKINAIDAWQTSTRFKDSIRLSAHLAVDGDRYNNDSQKCAHTDVYPSSWTMEFEYKAEVSHVIVYFINNQIYNYRNTNIVFLISETRQDSENNIGTDCATYIGPPASPLPPVKVTCKSHVTGKFLKVKKDNHNQVLCEVEVYST